MTKRRFIFLIINLLLVSVVTYAQQSYLLLNNGKRINISDYHITTGGDSLIKYTNLKGKVHEHYLEDVFSVTNKKNQKTIFYRPNTEIDDTLTIKQMENYVTGINFGRSIKISKWVGLGSFALGFGSAFIPNPSIKGVYIPLNMTIPVANIIIMNNIKTPKKIFARKTTNMPNNNKYYIMGVEDSFRRNNV